MRTCVAISTDDAIIIRRANLSKCRTMNIQFNIIDYCRPSSQSSAPSAIVDSYMCRAKKIHKTKFESNRIEKKKIEREKDINVSRYGVIASCCIRRFVEQRRRQTFRIDYRLFDEMI